MNGEGEAYTKDYFYLYYRSVDDQPIPYASVYMNEYESQDVVNAILKKIKDEGDRDIRGWFDRIDEGVRDVESENDAISGTDKKSSNTSPNGKMGVKLSRKGKYFDTPELYSKVKRADSGSTGRGKVNITENYNGENKKTIVIAREFYPENGGANEGQKIDTRGSQGRGYRPIKGQPLTVSHNSQTERGARQGKVNSLHYNPRDSNAKHIYQLNPPRGLEWL